jgi:hypothetical protein
MFGLGFCLADWLSNSSAAGPIKCVCECNIYIHTGLCTLTNIRRHGPVSMCMLHCVHSQTYIHCM